MLLSVISKQLWITSSIYWKWFSNIYLEMYLFKQEQKLEPISTEISNIFNINWQSIDNQLTTKYPDQDQTSF